MSKQSGLGDNLYVGGYNLSGDIGSLGRIGGGHSTFEATGIDKSGMERLALARDGSLEWSAFFNPAAGQAHPVLSALPRTDVVVTYCRGTSLGSPGAGLVGKQISYDGSRGADGAFTFSVTVQANGYGLDWGKQLTAGVRADTAATNGTGVDFGEGTSFGLQAFLHVFAFAGTDATIKLQQSSDNGAGDAYADVTGGAFTAVGSAPTSQRIQTARDQAVERYLRVVTTTSAGFTALSFAVLVCKPTVATVF